MNTVEKITDLIEKKGVQYKEFSNDLGLPKNIVSEWKNGRLKPSIEHIVKIADYFGVTTDYLLKGENEFKNEKENEEMTREPNMDIINPALVDIFKDFTEYNHNDEILGVKDLKNKTGISLKRMLEFKDHLVCPTLDELLIMSDKMRQKTDNINVAIKELYDCRFVSETEDEKIEKIVKATLKAQKAETEAGADKSTDKKNDASAV